METKRKKDRMEVLMDDVRLAVCIGIAGLVLITVILVLVVAIICK